MSSVSSRREPTLRDRAPPPIVWRSWRIVDQWRDSLSIVAVCIVVTGVALYSTMQVGIAAVVLVATVLATWRVWMPVTYEMDARGIHQRVWRQRRLPWHAVGRCTIVNDGIQILRSDEAGIPNAAGLFIPWKGNRAEVLAMVEYYLDPRSRRSGPSTNTRKSISDLRVPPATPAVDSTHSTGAAEVE